MLGADEIGESEVGREVGDHDGRGDRRPVAESHAGDAIVFHQNLLDLGPEAHLATTRDEKLAEVFGERSDTAGELGHHGGAVVGHGQRKGQAGRAAGGVGAAVGGVDGQKREHPAHDGVLFFVR